MNETNYRSVVENMRLADGTVWSIPVTLAVEEAAHLNLPLDKKLALVGEDGVIYAIDRYRKYL